MEGDIANMGQFIGAGLAAIGSGVSAIGVGHVAGNFLVGRSAQPFGRGQPDGHALHRHRLRRGARDLRVPGRAAADVRRLIRHFRASGAGGDVPRPPGRFLTKGDSHGNSDRDAGRGRGRAASPCRTRHRACRSSTSRRSRTRSSGCLVMLGVIYFISAGWRCRGSARFWLSGRGRSPTTSPPPRTCSRRRRRPRRPTTRRSPTRGPRRSGSPTRPAARSRGISTRRSQARRCRDRRPHGRIGEADRGDPRGGDAERAAGRAAKRPPRHRACSAAKATTRRIDGAVVIANGGLHNDPTP